MILCSNGRTLADVHTERHVIGALMFEPGVLEQCDELDLDDLHDIRNQHVLAAVRDLQGSGYIQAACGKSWVCPRDVVRCIQHEDVGRQQHVLDQLGGWMFFADLLLEFSPYRERMLLEHDLGWLRTLAYRRKSVAA